MRMSNPKIEKRMDSVGEVFVGSQRFMPANQLKENDQTKRNQQIGFYWSWRNFRAEITSSFIF